MTVKKTIAPDTRSIETILFQSPVPYETAYTRQIERRDAIEADSAGDALFLLEHTPVYTLGRKARREHLLVSEEVLTDLGIDVCEVDRGGDITYHGPGQLVAYPILDLQYRKTSISWYLRALEQVLIDLLDDYGLMGERVKGYTGVWVDGAKVAAVGIGIHNWVTYHGIALNVDPNMEHFRNIVPCGIPDKPVTTLKALLGTPPPLSEVADRFAAHFHNTFSGREGRASARPTCTEPNQGNT